MACEAGAVHLYGFHEKISDGRTRIVLDQDNY